jgi:aerobic-type carbon monoxide dehydrogenase small subunit (CoxS/CutS family)
MNELGEKLVLHYKGSIQTAHEYNLYMLNDKLFHTLAHDGKTTQNSGVCVLIVNDETYYVKLTRITEVDYYNTTKYVMFKCD